MLPPMLQGIVSADELKKHTAFQQQTYDDPAIKEINAKIAKLTQEIQQLRTEANATREKLISANPEMKKIHDKITAAMRTRSGGSGPMPVPISNNTK